MWKSAVLEILWFLKIYGFNKLLPKLADYRAIKWLALTHSDVCGFFQIQTIGGIIYFLTFMDDYIRLTIPYLLDYLDYEKAFAPLVSWSTLSSFITEAE